MSVHVSELEMGECFKIKGVVRQGYITSLFFNLFKDGVVREVIAKAGSVGIERSIDNTKWKFNTTSILFSDDTVILAESEKDF